MTKRTLRASVACAIAAALLAGCGGGSGSTPPVSKPPVSGQTANVKMTFHFNNQTGTGTSLRGRKYTSRATHGLSIMWEQSTQDGVPHFPNSPSIEAAMQANANFVTAIAPQSQLTNTTNNVTCDANAAPDGSFNCTVLMPITTGYTDFRIATWDQAPATYGTNNDGFGGTFASTANDLSINTLMTYRIQSNQTNSFNFTMNGVVNSVSLSVVPGTLVSGGQSQTATLNVLALDADGNIIIGNDPYVDVNGNPVTITVTKNHEDYPVPLTGPAAPANGDVTFAAGPNCATANTCTITDPTVQALTVNYNAYEISDAMFTATTTNSAPVQGATLNFTNSTNGPITVPGSPTISNLVINGGAYQLRSIAAGAYGNSDLYVADPAGNQIEEITPGNSPTVSRTFTIPTAASGITGVAMGADTNVYGTEFGAGKVAVVQLGTGNVSETTGLTSPNGIASGPDNNIYVTSTTGDKLYEIQVVGEQFSTAANQYPVIATQSATQPVYADVAGPDGNIWFSERTSVGYTSPGFGSFTEVAIPGATGPLFSIAAGADGDIYVGDQGGHKVYQISTAAGTKGQVLQTWATTYAPTGLVAARDGNIYVAEEGSGLAGAASAIGRIDPTALAGQPVEYTSGVLTGNAFPWGIAQGADNQIYFTYANAGTVGYFAP